MDKLKNKLPDNISQLTKDEFEDFIKDGYAVMMEAVKVSNNLTASHRLAPNNENVDTQYKNTSDKIKSLSDNIISSILSFFQVSSGGIGSNVESLPELNDTIVDIINKDLADLSSSSNTREKINTVEIVKTPSWNLKPVISSLQLGNTKMLAAKNVERPQVSFKDPVDNSTKTLWVPKITQKPNNVKPLAIMPICDSNGEAVGYCHPYETELEIFTPRPEFLKNLKEIPPFKELHETPLIHVNTLPELKELVKHLYSVKEIAVDLEHHSYRTYQGITCLIQITTEKGDYLVDTFPLREHLHLLNESFTDPKILKIFHGAICDIIWLQRDFGVYVVGLFDTHVASVTMDYPKLSLQALVQRYCNITIEKKFQLADWRIRPLPEELCEYARSDTHYLLYIWRRLKQDLIEKANGKTNLLEVVFNKSKEICAQTYTKPVLNDESHMDLYIKSRKHFNKKQLTALKSLYQWRDLLARTEDESTGYVLPNHMMLQIAETLPREMQGLLACCNPVPPLLRKHLLPVHQMILAARDVKLESSIDVEMTAIVPTPLAPRLSLVHDKLVDVREGLPVYFSGAIKLKHVKKNVKRKPYSLETPPNKLKQKVNVETISKLFVPPFERYKLVKEYNNIIHKT